MYVANHFRGVIYISSNVIRKFKIYVCNVGNSTLGTIQTVRKRLDRRVLGAWWRPVVLVRDSSWTILGSTCFDKKILRLTFLLQALCKRSVVTFVGYALLRVGRTLLGKTPVGLTAELFTDPSFDQQPWEAVSDFNLVFLLGIAP